MKFKKAYNNMVFRLITIWRILFAKSYIVACDNTLRYNSNIYHAYYVKERLVDIIENDIAELKIKQQVDDILSQKK